MVSVSDHSIPAALVAAWLGCHDDGMPAFLPGKLWIIPRICSSSTCRQPRASVLETTSFLSQHEWQEAFSFRSEILSREHLFTSYFSFLVIVDTRDVQPAFRSYISPYKFTAGAMQRYPCEHINAMPSERVKVSPAYCQFPALPFCAGSSQSFDGLRILKFPDSFGCFLRMVHKLHRLFPDVFSSFHMKKSVLRNCLVN